LFKRAKIGKFTVRKSRNSMIKTEEEFKNRAYTKVELACLYNPHMTIPGALRILARWIAGNSQLTAELSALEYNHRNRIYTPRQVKAIVDYLGEP
jgi:hypothetical protein